MPPEGSPSERLRAVLEVWLDYVESHSYAWQMLFRDTAAGVPIEASRRELHARAREVLADDHPLARRAAIPAARSVRWPS